MWTERFAPAKLNLFLHVGPVGGDGYHPVASLMVFADVGDQVRLRTSGTMAFRLEGDFAAELSEDPDNLVTRARDRLLALAGDGVPPFEIVLRKALPIAAGLGGGSADAAAALVLIRRHMETLDRGAALDDRAVLAVARSLGADVAACVASAPVIATGRGDMLSPAPRLPSLDAVLVNPRAPSPTGPVYRAFDALAPGAGADMPDLPEGLATAHAVAGFLARTRNDLEAPAVGLEPRIGEALGALAASPEALFSRMSGSGATCFAITANRDAARTLADRLLADHPTWWVRACRIGG